MRRYRWVMVWLGVLALTLMCVVRFHDWFSRGLYTAGAMFTIWMLRVDYRRARRQA